MRIIHTSDWHLGRIFHGIHMTEDQQYVLEQFVDLVKDTKPHMILVAGDIFDRSVPPVEAVNLLDDVVSQILMDHQVPIMMIAGNHDSPDRLSFGSRLLQNRGLNISGKLSISKNPIILEDQHGPVFFYALPYVEPPMVREIFSDETIHGHDASMAKLLEQLKLHLNTKQRNVLISHAFVGGGEESESERPLSIGGSGIVNASYFKEFDYVALGHLHRPQNIGDNIRYSGSLMKYSFSEAQHKKHVSLIELGEKGQIKIEEIELKPKRDLRVIEGHLRDILKGPKPNENPEDYIMVTLKDEGALLDAMGQIKKVYKNVLHIERPQFTVGKNLISADRNFKKMSEVDLFASFVHQVTEREMSDLQRDVFAKMLDKYYQSMRRE